jgi:hypothetical protein
MRIEKVAEYVFFSIIGLLVFIAVPLLVAVPFLAYAKSGWSGFFLMSGLYTFIALMGGSAYLAGRPWTPIAITDPVDLSTPC